MKDEKRPWSLVHANIGASPHGQHPSSSMAAPLKDGDRTSIHAGSGHGPAVSFPLRLRRSMGPSEPHPEASCEPEKKANALWPTATGSAPAPPSASFFRTGNATPTRMVAIGEWSRG